MKDDNFNSRSEHETPNTYFGEQRIFNNKLINALFDDARTPIIVTDEDFSVIRVNKAAAMFFGRTEESAVGIALGELTTPVVMSWIQGASRTLRLDGEKIQEGFELLDCLGGEHRLALTVRFLASERYGLFNYLITMREDAGPAEPSSGMVDPQLSIGRLMRGLSDAVLLIDNQSGTICDCNEAAPAMFGYEREEILGRSPQFLAADYAYAQELTKISHAAYVRQGFYQSKIRCRRKDGGVFTTLGTNITFFSQRGELRYTLAINRDISEDERRLSEVSRLARRTKECIEALARSLEPLVSDAPRGKLSGLGFSERQIKIASLLCEAEPSKRIAGLLKIPESTVKSHIHSMYARLGVASKIEFVNYLRTHNIDLE
jgi:PAS domain S-box-containing protein